MASNDTTEPAAPKRHSLRLIALIVLAVLALGDGALLLYLHYGRQAAPPAPPAQPAPAPAPQAAGGPLAPSFDIVRVDPQGNAVLAGRAVPGATVTVKDGDSVLGTVTADAQGAFVMIPANPLPPGSHEITLSEALPGGNVVEGSQSASISLPGNGKPALAVVSGPNGSSVVTGQGPQPGQLGMGAVDYDAQGHAMFSGTAPAGANVTVMLGGKAIGTAKAETLRPLAYAGACALGAGHDHPERHRAGRQRAAPDHGALRAGGAVQGAGGRPCDDRPRR